MSQEAATSTPEYAGELSTAIQNLTQAAQIPERAGFEPTVEFPPLRFSSPLHHLRLIRTS